ncbi:FkbM family methyltransferase [Halochromatium roseum]|uniref:FkbM family methyltransferase n=1 Tax=Halochromatium roseum TaxID=391920 RepID=UPI0019130EB5|nr:FkbM family methyltransferase [Halochromatium roseum]
MLPLDVIIEFEQRSLKPFAFDWECVLERGYRRFLTPESCVIDVGGHAGRHARVFVDEIGCRQVTLFEPLPRQYQQLQRRFAPHPRVRVLPFALSSESGRQDFIINQAAPEESGLRERLYNNPAGKRLRSISVEVSTLDALSAQLGEHIDYIKIDTEGAEIDILRGATRTLARHQPVISVEYGLSSYVAYGHDRMTLYETATALGYRVCDLFGNPFDREQWDNVVDRFYWDYYLVPRDKAADFQARLWDGVYRELETHCKLR